MTENEVIEQLEIFPEWNRDDRWICADDMEKLVNFCIKAIEEIQQYRTIGTVEEFRNCMDILNKAEADELAQIIDEWILYHKIGTVEECREARERQVAKQPIILCKQSAKSEGQLFVANYSKCPTCGNTFTYFGGIPNNCHKCGQALKI